MSCRVYRLSRRRPVGCCAPTNRERDARELDPQRDDRLCRLDRARVPCGVGSCALIQRGGTLVKPMLQKRSLCAGSALAVCAAQAAAASNRPVGCPAPAAPAAFFRLLECAAVSAARAAGPQRVCAVAAPVVRATRSIHRYALSTSAILAEVRSPNICFTLDATACAAGQGPIFVFRRATEFAAAPGLPCQAVPAHRLRCRFAPARRSVQPLRPNRAPRREIGRGRNRPLYAQTAQLGRCAAEALCAPRRIRATAPSPKRIFPSTMLNP